MTSNKSIASVSRFTLANSVVVCCRAIGESTTNPRTGVSALLADTGFISRAFCIDHTFWFALNVRIANVVSNAFA